MSATVWLVVIDIAVVAGVSIGFGAVAPRLPEAWFAKDPLPLRLARFETVSFYRRVGVSRMSKRLPELGAAFGGESKSTLPGGTVQELSSYLREVRRAEWVHWVSVASPLILFAINPWWLALAFVIVVAVGNAPFILILRNNRLRITRIIERDETRP